MLNNIRVLLAVSLVLFVVYSMVNVAETRPSLIEKVANRTKRQTGYWKVCLIDDSLIICDSDEYCEPFGCHSKFNKLNYFL